MKKFLRCCTVVLGAGIGLVLLTGLVLYTIGRQKLTKSYPNLPVETIAIPVDEAAITRGRHIAVTWSCTYCHGDDLSGKLIEDNSFMGTIPATNLTSGEGGIGESYTDIDWIRAIRHGVKPDGRGEIMMGNYYTMSDQDLSDLIAYLKQIPPVDSYLPAMRIGTVLPLAPAIGYLVPAAEQIDHNAPHPMDPLPDATVEYGSYLSTICMGCHSSNLTSKFEGWSQDEFVRMMQTGVSPNGEQLGAGMPLYAEMHETELTALWLYFQSTHSTTQK
ncbi:MAG: c-type cytochrome [Anaerolineales bacterium]